MSVALRCSALLLAALANASAGASMAAVATDPHSFANVAEMQVRHLDLFVDVDFSAQRLSGVVDLRVERRSAEATRLVLDTRDVIVRQVWIVHAATDLRETSFEIGATDAVLGEPLTVAVPSGPIGSSFTVRISYQTRPEASGLQWLAPAQTAGKTDPFLFSQSQAIHGRSWIPMQDTPQLRITYTAQIRVPPGLRAVMSANNDAVARADGVYRFDMPQPIPSYLIAIAVGRLDWRELGPRTAIYAEPPIIDAAAREFADTEKMLAACETLFGPYRWERYDVLVLPPSFPYGGMENPRLTFLTPTVIAGDRSLVALIAHELAHSWSGNLVTNATWSDFWLNEGFTVFLERRILGALYGERRRAMEDVLGLQSLRREIATLEPRDQILGIDLRGRDPENATTDIAYEKGRFFLGWLESRFGAAAIDGWLRNWFDTYAFQTVTSAQFRAYLEQQLLPMRPGAVTAAEIDEWLNSPGLPDFAVLPQSDAFTKVDAARADWLARQRSPAELPTAEWSTFEWLHFLDNMPATLDAARMAELDATFRMTDGGNAEIVHVWLKLAIRHGYEPAMPRLEDYLVGIGRRKLIRPLYEALMQTPAGRLRAARIYERARPGYHPIAVATLDAIVRPPAKAAVAR